MTRALAPHLLAVALAGCGDGGKPAPPLADLGPPGPDLATLPTADGPSGDLGSRDLAAPPDLTSGDEAQRPPPRRADLEAWLAKGFYKAWRCEPAPHDARPPGAHGRNRICTNDLLATSPGPGDFPIGAASVKELWDQSAISGLTVAVRVAPGAGGGSWYWYERLGNSVIADGTGVGLCVGCHGGAPRDFVYTVVK